VAGATESSQLQFEPFFLWVIVHVVDTTTTSTTDATDGAEAPTTPDANEEWERLSDAHSNAQRSSVGDDAEVAEGEAVGGDMNDDDDDDVRERSVSANPSVKSDSSCEDFVLISTPSQSVSHTSSPLGGSSRTGSSLHSARGTDDVGVTAPAPATAASAVVADCSVADAASNDVVDETAPLLAEAADGVVPEASALVAVVDRPGYVMGLLGAVWGTSETAATNEASPTVSSTAVAAGEVADDVNDAAVTNDADAFDAGDEGAEHESVSQPQSSSSADGDDAARAVAVPRPESPGGRSDASSLSEMIVITNDDCASPAPLPQPSSDNDGVDEADVAEGTHASPGASPEDVPAPAQVVVRAVATAARPVGCTNSSADGAAQGGIHDPADAVAAVLGALSGAIVNAAASAAAASPTPAPTAERDLPAGASDDDHSRVRSWEADVAWARLIKARPEVEHTAEQLVGERF
jgi:hypothetical protein